MSPPTPSLRRLVAVVLLVLAGTAVTVDAYIESRRPDAFRLVQWSPASVSAPADQEPECEAPKARECPGKCAAPATVASRTCMPS